MSWVMLFDVVRPLPYEMRAYRSALCRSIGTTLVLAGMLGPVLAGVITARFVSFA
jgi:hypothetical protein